MCVVNEESPQGAREEFGRRLRTLRRNARLTVREAARLSGLDKNTVVRLEAGAPSRPSTRERLCAAYGVFNVDLAELRDRESGRGWAMFRPERARWHRSRLVRADAPSAVSTGDAMQVADERFRQGSLRLANQFFARIACDRAEGAMKAMFFEVYGPSGIARQPSGEAFVYVLSGAIRFEVGDESFTLAAGCAATFDRTLPHCHDVVAESGLPATMLYVQTD